MITAPLLDHRALDLDRARRITYQIDQSFAYTYEEPITALTQRLVIVPRHNHNDQHRRAYALHVFGAVTHRSTRRDAAGNTVVRIRAAEVQTRVEFRVTALVDRVRDGRPPTLSPAVLGDPRLRQTTRLTAPDDGLRALAADVQTGGGGPLDLADRACAAVHAAIVYDYGVTTVTTTAAEALAGGRGVCQDSAHVMVAVCHLLGLPVRYVSGHLLGQGGTHAWVEVLVPDRHGAVAVAFDPCHGRRIDGRYLTVAVGRDYHDVAPTSGYFTGLSGSQLTTSRNVGVVAID